MTNSRKEFEWNTIELSYPGSGRNYHGNEMRIGEDVYMYTMMKFEPYFGLYLNGVLEQRYLHSSAAVGAILEAKKRYIAKNNKEDGIPCESCGQQYP